MKRELNGNEKTLFLFLVERKGKNTHIDQLKIKGQRTLPTRRGQAFDAENITSSSCCQSKNSRLHLSCVFTESCVVVFIIIIIIFEERDRERGKLKIIE